MFHLFKFFVCVGLSALCANDTTVSILSGGIVIEEQEPNIAMVSEKLTISEKAIKVSYVFFNHGPTKKVKLGFPLPPAPYVVGESHYVTWDECAIALRVLYGNADKETDRLFGALKYAPIIDFSVLVNSEHIHATPYTRAIKPTGQDVTDLLRQNDIPLSSAYLRGFCEQSPMDQFPGMQGKLEKLGLLNAGGIPSWQLHTTYVWESQFDAQKETHIEHVYTPHVGNSFIQSQDFDTPQNFKAASRLQSLVTQKSPEDQGINLNECTFDGQHFKAFIESWNQKIDHNMESQWGQIKAINYILKTGANWRGPIGKFCLEIHPANPDDLIIIMGKYPMKRLDSGVCVVEIDKFEPTENLCVLFVCKPSTLRKNISTTDQLVQWFKGLFVRFHSK